MVQLLFAHVSYVLYLLKHILTDNHVIYTYKVCAKIDWKETGHVERKIVSSILKNKYNY